MCLLRGLLVWLVYRFRRKRLVHAPAAFSRSRGGGFYGAANSVFRRNAADFPDCLVARSLDLRRNYKTAFRRGINVGGFNACF